MDFSAAERAVLERLDAALARPRVRAHIDAIAGELVRDLDARPEAAMTWRPVPLALYGDAVADDVRSSWVFALRRGAASGAERHPNSRQRMMSYAGSGDFPTKRDLADEWETTPLVSDPDAPLERRWVSIPANTWHQGVVHAREHWVVVSFQTAPAEELIEERPADGASGFVRKHYV